MSYLEVAAVAPRAGKSSSSSRLVLFIVFTVKIITNIQQLLISTMCVISAKSPASQMAAPHTWRFAGWFDVCGTVPGFLWFRPLHLLLSAVFRSTPLLRGSPLLLPMLCHGCPNSSFHLPVLVLPAQISRYMKTYCEWSGM